MIRTSSNKLKPGDVIKFDIPLFNFSAGSINTIIKNPSISHYAIVIDKTGKIGDKDFKGHNAIKLTHCKDSKPSIPYLSRYSFIPKESDMGEIKKHFYYGQKNLTMKPYSRPNENPYECAICSIHDDGLKKYNYIGKVKRSVFPYFKGYYDSNKDNMNHLLIDKNGDPYYVDDKFSKIAGSNYLMAANGDWVSRSSIAESLDYQNGYILLILPDWYINDIELESPYTIRDVRPQEDYTLLLCFNDGKRGVYDMWPLIQQKDGGDDTFVPLEDINFFMQAYKDGDLVAWDDYIDIDSEELYENSMSLKEYRQWIKELEYCGY